MLPELQLVLTIASNILIITLVLYYFFSVRNKEKKLEKEQNEADANYHHVVDDALSKERKILDDATNQANQILTQSKYLTNDSQKEINNAIGYVVANIQKEGEIITRSFTTEYTAALKNTSGTSLSEFQNIMSQLQVDLKKQIDDFHNALLPKIEQELETYKKARMQQVDKAAVDIAQKASQEIFNKTISMSDHQNAVIQSLERAKKEGIFD